MKVNDKTVAVDNDFISHISDTSMNIDDIIKNTREIFMHFDMVAIIHPLVYKYEVPIGNQRFNKIFDAQVIQIIEFKDVFPENSEEKLYYIYLVKELFGSLSGEQMPFSDDEILCSWIRGKSLGEIHSLSMCLICDSSLFLSDDNDSKKLKKIIEQKNLGKINVYNRKELMETYRSSGGNSVSRTDLRRLAHSI